MGKSMYNFGKQGKEKARQQKQMDKAANRIMAKQQKDTTIDVSRFFMFQRVLMIYVAGKVSNQDYLY